LQWKGICGIHMRKAFSAHHSANETAMVMSFPHLSKSRLDSASVHYNLARIHKSLRITPAMAAGLSDHVWNLEEIVMMADGYAPKPGKRGPYKKRISN
jgi:hypothetical protein